MNITPINYSHNYPKVNSNNELSFGHGNNFLASDYSIGQKAVVVASTALGVAASMAVLAKKGGYSIKPKNFFINMKKFISNVHYDDWKKIVTIGAGSCLGGLAGGYLIDKNKENRKAKNREAIMHFGNIAIPIITVDFVTDKLCKNAGKWTKAFAALGGILGGVYLANFVMNKVSNVLFQDKSQERGVRLTDFPSHLDDVIVAAGFIAPDSKLIHKIGRIVPLALMVAGNEAGTAKAKHY